MILDYKGDVISNTTKTASEEIDPEDYNPKKHPKLDKRARGETAEFEDWVKKNRL